MGPTMKVAYEYIRENPGCIQSHVYEAIEARGDHWQTIKRLERDGYIRRIPVLSSSGFPRAYRLYVNE